MRVIAPTFVAALVLVSVAAAGSSPFELRPVATTGQDGHAHLEVSPEGGRLRVPAQRGGRVEDVRPLGHPRDLLEGLSLCGRSAAPRRRPGDESRQRRLRRRLEEDADARSAPGVRERAEDRLPTPSRASHRPRLSRSRGSDSRAPTGISSCETGSWCRERSTGRRRARRSGRARATRCMWSRRRRASRSSPSGAPSSMQRSRHGRPARGSSRFRLRRRTLRFASSVVPARR
jgi:hypothetical protein